jgi:hypothetical protein
VSEGEPLVGDAVTAGIVRIGDTVLPRSEAWLREAAPAIAARLSQPG